jgi:hypothetical protein
MKDRIVAGAAGGLVGGVVLDLVMRVMSAAGGESMTAYAAGVVHSSHPVLGWIVYPAYGVIIGAIFGWLVHEQPLEDVAATLWGGLYGIGWWIVSGLVLIPILYPSWPFSIAAVDRAREVAFPLLLGHIVYGLVMGLVWSQLAKRMSQRQHPGATQLPQRRAA